MYKLTQNIKLTQIIEFLMRNRRFFASLAGNNRRWRNGLPRDSVFVSILFNIHTNYQFIWNDNKIKHLIYTDDAAIPVQNINFETTEEKLTNTLEDTSKYYINNL